MISEEDMKLIAESMIPVIQEILKSIESTSDDAYHTIESVTKILSDRIVTIGYEHQRDMNFIKTLFRQVEFANYAREKNFIESNYKSYCDEYNKLNTHLLEEKLQAMK
jgi:hypothetical protein